MKIIPASPKQFGEFIRNLNNNGYTRQEESLDFALQNHSNFYNTLTGQVVPPINSDEFFSLLNKIN